MIRNFVNNRKRRDLAKQKSDIDNSNKRGGSTYSFWKKAIAGTQPSAIAQCDSTRGRLRLVVDNFFMTIVCDESFEPVHQIWVAADEAANLVHKNILVDEVLREKVTKL